ncbi:alpha/beta fold hydrolase [Mucilaginibacter sp. SJ]|uniref:alpha/beta fold hydrolase n=1 Tax=Mucilaginibacter sp. SJ TaxID=3029053 RepID=UPI0023A916F4|nr:hypothetical protein [Mucilaginibacter sp. SJ]WEA00545.1 hypothetical protein MusilaSJ_24110 [Mucilaginibacter sp. SJ]
MSKLAARTSPYTVAEALLRIEQFDVSAQLHSIDVPILIIGAENDRLTSLEASVDMHRKIAGSN